MIAGISDQNIPEIRLSIIVFVQRAIEILENLCELILSTRNNDDRSSRNIFGIIGVHGCIDDLDGGLIIDKILRTEGALIIAGHFVARLRATSGTSSLSHGDNRVDNRVGNQKPGKSSIDNRRPRLKIESGLEIVMATDNMNMITVNIILV